MPLFSSARILALVFGWHLGFKETMSQPRLITYNLEEMLLYLSSCLYLVTAVTFDVSKWISLHVDSLPMKHLEPLLFGAMDMQRPQE